MGHPSNKVLDVALSSLKISCPSHSDNGLPHCKHCLSGKMHQFSFPISTFHASKPLELVHSDVWGPAPVTSTNDFQYYLLFVDEYSKFSWLYLLKHKSDVLDIFKFFKATVETQLDSKIKVLRTDNGGEYTSNAFKHFCSTQGIIHQFSCPHTPQQNGVAERKHRHIIECALTMLSHSQLPPSYWSYAVSTAMHIINRLPTPLLKNLTPWELLFKSKPDITHLRSFGCVCFPLLKPYNSHKLQPHTTPCIFLGYPAHTKGYICQHPQTSRIYISRHVHFNELEFFTPQSLTTGPPPTSSIQFSTQCPVIFPFATQPLNSVFTPSQPSPTHSTPTPIPDFSSQSSLPNAPDQSQSTPVSTSSTSPPHPIPTPIPIAGS